MIKRPFNLKERVAHLEEFQTDNGNYYYEIHIVTSKGTLKYRGTIVDFEQANKTAIAINKKGVIDLNFWGLYSKDKV